MTPDEAIELIDLDLDSPLPDALRARVESYLAADPAAARDAAALRAAVADLQSLPPERPDAWFVERCLDGLLRENARTEQPLFLKRTH